MIHNDEHEPITVLMDYKGERRIHPFYCSRCGKCLCETTGIATALIPGFPGNSELTTLKVTHIIRCTGVIYLGDNNRIKCSAKYIFT